MKENYLAVALGKKDIGEADRLYFFYTQEEGMISIAAKGVRKSAAKLASHTEDYMLTRIVIAKNFGPGTLAGAYLENSFPALREQYDTLCLLERMRSIFVRLLRGQQRDEKIFALLVTFLLTLERSIEEMTQSDGDRFTQQDFLTNIFLLKLYSEMGYTFLLSQCVLCSQKLIAQKNYFSAYDGGILCPSCARTCVSSAAIDPDTLKAMRITGGNDFIHAQKVTVTPRITGQLQMITDHIAKWIMR